MIEVTISGDYTDSGEEEIHSFPSKKEVCPNCKGEGKVLCGGLRHLDFTLEEFRETFDEEERYEYFHGDMFNVVCPLCRGLNVIDVIDRSACKDVRALQAWDLQEKERLDSLHIQKLERMMGA